MNKRVSLILVFVLLWIFGAVNYFQAQAVNEEKGGYLIISQNFCIIVSSPAKQFTSSLGRTDLGIILKDQVTHIYVCGNYVAIAVPLNELSATIKKYQLQKLTFIE